MKYATLIGIAVFTAHAQTPPSAHTAISVVPPFPADGIFREHLTDQYVFLKGSGYVVSFSGSLDLGRPAGPNGRVEFPIVFPRQVTPVIDVDIERLATGGYVYSYTVVTRRDSKTGLSSIALGTRSIEAVDGLSAMTNSPGWTVARFRDPGDHLGPVWTSPVPLRTGDVLRFSFRSMAKPGITEATIRGTLAVAEDLDRLPAPVRAQIGKLARGILGRVHHLTVGPTYAPETNAFALAAGLFEQTAMFRQESNTPYLAEVRSQLKQYLDSVASTIQFVEDNKTKPQLRTSAVPASYEDGLVQKVVATALSAEP